MAQGIDVDPAAREIEERILGFVQTELLARDSIVGFEDDLLSDLLDSVSILRLVTFIDESFGVSTQPGDFVVENFETVSLMAQYVQRSRAGR